MDLIIGSMIGIKKREIYIITTDNYKLSKVVMYFFFNVFKKW